MKLADTMSLKTMPAPAMIAIVGIFGPIAEELVFDDITTGASQDIKQATETARSMVTKYGFSSKLGLINYDNDSDEVFIGRDLAHTRPYGEEVASQIDTEVKNIIDECYGKAKKMIEEQRDIRALVDSDEVHCLMIGASGVGKTAFFLYPNLEYACACGMSYLALDTKGDLARNYGCIASKYYGYRIFHFPF